MVVLDHEPDVATGTRVGSEVAGRLVAMVQPTPAELEHIRELLSVVTPLPGQLERLQQIIDAEAGELSPTALSLLQQRQAKSA